MNHLHDFNKREESKDLESTDELFKIRTLDSCLGFCNDILLSSLQLFCTIPQFQEILKDAVDAAYEREDDNEEDDEPYESIEKLTPTQVTEHRPLQIVPKIIGADEPSSKKGTILSKHTNVSICPSRKTRSTARFCITKS